MVDLMEFYFDTNRPLGVKLDLTNPKAPFDKVINAMEQKQSLYMDIPERGDMNIDDVMDAEFFFSWSIFSFKSILQFIKKTSK